MLYKFEKLLWSVQSADKSIVVYKVMPVDGEGRQEYTYTPDYFEMGIRCAVAQPCPFQICCTHKYRYDELWDQALEAPLPEELQAFYR